MEEERPFSSNVVDLHLYVIPDCGWCRRRKVAKRHVLESSISSGFVRVDRDLTLEELRPQISLQVREVPTRYVFLRQVGRNLTQVKPWQEDTLKVKHFVPPKAPEPEIFLKEGLYSGLRFVERRTYDVDSGLGSSDLKGSNDSSSSTDKKLKPPSRRKKLGAGGSPSRLPTVARTTAAPSKTESLKKPPRNNKYSESLEHSDARSGTPSLPSIQAHNLVNQNANHEQGKKVQENFLPLHQESLGSCGSSAPLGEGAEESSVTDSEKASTLEPQDSGPRPVGGLPAGLPPKEGLSSKNESSSNEDHLPAKEETRGSKASKTFGPDSRPAKNSSNPLATPLKRSQSLSKLPKNSRPALNRSKTQGVSRTTPSHRDQEKKTKRNEKLTKENVHEEINNNLVKNTAKKTFIIDRALIPPPLAKNLLATDESPNALEKRILFMSIDNEYDFYKLEKFIENNLLINENLLLDFENLKPEKVEKMQRQTSSGRGDSYDLLARDQKIYDRDSGKLFKELENLSANATPTKEITQILSLVGHNVVHDFGVRTYPGEVEVKDVNTRRIVDMGSPRDLSNFKTLSTEGAIVGSIGTGSSDTSSGIGTLQVLQASEPDEDERFYQLRRARSMDIPTLSAELQRAIKHGSRLKSSESVENISKVSMRKKSVRSLKRMLDSYRRVRLQMAARHEEYRLEVQRLQSSVALAKLQLANAWRQKYLRARRAGSRLSSTCTKMAVDLDTALAQAITRLVGSNIGQGTLSNLIQAAKMAQETELLRQRVAAASLHLAAEHRLKMAAKNHVKKLREELVSKKIQVTLTRQKLMPFYPDIDFLAPRH